MNQIAFSAVLIIIGGLLLYYKIWKTSLYTRWARWKSFFVFALFAILGFTLLPSLIFTPEGLNNNSYTVFGLIFAILIAIMVSLSIDQMFPYRMVLISKGTRKFVIERRAWRFFNHYPLDLNTVCFKYEDEKDFNSITLNQISVYVNFAPMYLYREYSRIDYSKKPRQTEISMQQHLPTLYEQIRETISTNLVQRNLDIIQGYFSDPNTVLTYTPNWKKLTEFPLSVYLLKLNLDILPQGEPIIDSIRISRVPKQEAGSIILK